MRWYFIKTLLRHNLVFSAGLSAFLSIGAAVLGRLSATETLGTFVANLQFCLVSVGLGFAFFVFHRFHGHTRPLYWNLGIGTGQLAVLGIASGAAAWLALGLAIAAWGAIAPAGLAFPAWVDGARG